MRQKTTSRSQFMLNTVLPLILISLSAFSFMLQNPEYILMLIIAVASALVRITLLACKSIYNAVSRLLDRAIIVCKTRKCMKKPTDARPKASDALNSQQGVGNTMKIDTNDDDQETSDTKKDVNCFRKL